MTLDTKLKLPHSTDQMFLSDAGLETWLLFVKQFDMPHFASFPLLRNEQARTAMRSYFADFLEMARQNRSGFVLDTVTWRASPDWARLLGYDLDDLGEVNREAVRFAETLRTDFGAGVNVLINGVVGPRGDGYDAGTVMSVSEAEEFHSFQVDVFAHSKVDMVSAVTMTNANEAIGISRAAGNADIPCVISFTLETDGTLPSGQQLGDAIAESDSHRAAKPAYYMINCAHPDHFRDTLEAGGDWVNRIRGLRTNASRMSHAELDVCEVLDEGDPQELGQQYADMRRLLPNLNVYGGCCGTDHRHLSQICQAVRAA